MLIAIIDDGINSAFVPGLTLKYDFSIDKNGEISKRNREDEILTDHGTTCCGIIKKYAPEAEFCSLRIFHEEKLSANCDQLVAALEWCAEVRVPIVHMSVGSGLLRDYSRIRAAVAKLIQQRQIVVAAHSIRERYSIPACLGGVLGVVADEKMTDNEYTILPPSGASPSILASSRHRLVFPSGHEMTTQITNSYAAPTVTAAVHRIISGQEPFSMTVAQVHRALHRQEKNMQCLKPDFIENAHILNPHGYPILHHHLFFCSTEKATGCDLVYLASDESDTTDDFGRNLLDKSGRYNNFLYAGKLPQAINLKEAKSLIWSEDIYNETLYTNNETVNVDCPVVNIYGNDIESIDMLCHLRDIFISDGYQCVGLSGYRFSYLYGLEYIPKTVDRHSALSYTNMMYDPDIILYYFQESPLDIAPNPDEFNVVLGGLRIAEHDKNLPLSIYAEIVHYFST